MVLPAPAPDAAPASAAWLDRLTRILRLSAGGVIVLVDRARDERLGELVRRLRAERPEVDVLLEAPDLASAPEGAAVVLRLRPEDRTWLNLARPVVAQRALRLFLWSDEAATVALVQGAIDFFDWISHRVECPAGPPAFAARELVRLACARPPALAWYGAGFEEAFERALPGRKRASVSAALPYPELVRALKPEVRTWAAVTDIDWADRLQRVQWACTEAGRRGRTVLVNPSESGELPAVDVRAMRIDEAAARLREAGAARPARLAALLNLSEKGVETACGLLKSGVREAEIEARLSPDGWLSVPAAEERASTPGAPAGRRARFPAWPRKLPGFAERVKGALDAGDFAVARHWAAAWSESEPERAEAWMERAHLEMVVGDLAVAQTMLEKARGLLPPRPPAMAALHLAALEAAWLWETGAEERARAATKRTLDLGAALSRRTGSESMDFRAASVSERTRGSTVAEEPHSLDLASSTDRMDHGSDSAVQDILARLELELPTMLRAFEGGWEQRPFPVQPILAAARSASALSGPRVKDLDLDVGIAALRAALATLPERHAHRVTLEISLARLLSFANQTDEALRLLDQAAWREERLGGPLHRVFHRRGIILLQAGRFSEAEAALRRALRVRSAGFLAADTRLRLTRCLLEEARIGEATAAFEDLQRDHPSSLGPSMLRLEARLLVASDRLEDAARRAHEAAREANRAFANKPELLETILEAAAGVLYLAHRPREGEPYVRRVLHLAKAREDVAGQAEALRFLALLQRAQGFPQAADTERRAEELAHQAEAAGMRIRGPGETFRGLGRF